MTDRHSGYVITLDHDIREDDAERIITALRQIRGVVDVRPVVADGIEQHIAESRVRVEIAEHVQKLWQAVLNPDKR